MKLETPFESQPFRKDRLERQKKFRSIGTNGQGARRKRASSQTRASVAHACTTAFPKTD
jgi:hypothetical protein